MIFQTGTMESTCDKCGAPMNCAATEALIYGRHRWDLECTCRSCGNAQHTGGPAPVPQYVRDAILSSNTPSRISVSSEGGSGAALLKALRSINGGSIAEAKAAAEEMREVGREGTKVEIAMIKEALDAAGVGTLVSHPSED
ncbi:hypothetical protein ACH4UR_27145 [Streptomyces lydicus]|uniref:hypothetical protein n=1 Tax=Streptomyces lydicus TaxID=47763 RepID=UPI0033DB07BC